MKKDFQKWHTLKAKIDAQHPSPLFREQEIWWCSLGSNVGTEEDGKNKLFERPVIVIRKFSKDMFWGVPATLQKKEGVFYFTFTLFEQEQIALVSQIRTLSGKRLIRRMGKLSTRQFTALKDAVIVLFNKKADPLRDPRVPGGNL